jgi:hypothetical protein
VQQHSLNLREEETVLYTKQRVHLDRPARGQLIGICFSSRLDDGWAGAFLEKRIRDQNQGGDRDFPCASLGSWPERRISMVDAIQKGLKGPSG